MLPHRYSSKCQIANVYQCNLSPIVHSYSLLWLSFSHNRLSERFERWVSSISISTNRVNILLYFRAKLITGLDRSARGQLPCCLCVLCLLHVMHNEYLPTVCVLSAQLGLDAIGTLVMEAPTDWMIRAAVRRESLTCSQNTIILYFHVCLHSFCFSTGNHDGYECVLIGMMACGGV